MKCSRCWAEKAFVREVRGAKGLLLSFLFLVPLRCHHCYHKFTVPWLATVGQRTRSPEVAAAEQIRRRPSATATLPMVRDDHHDRDHDVAAVRRQAA